MSTRLTAILAADAAGYSRLMAEDENATVTALESARDVFRSHIVRHGGRVIDMAGDSVLAVFETASGALAAALAVQEQLEAVSADARRLRYRIGVHLGDIIDKADGTVYGNGVNIAARLQAMAEPGTVAVSEAVFGAVRSQPRLGFVDLGEQRVKNIPHPVRAFRVAAVPESRQGVAGESSLLLRLRLRQRKLVQWTLAYVAAAFALIQVLDVIGQRFGWPEAVTRLLIVALGVGFFVAVVVAWFHGERGAQRVTLLELALVGLVLMIGGGLLWRIAAHDGGPARLAAAADVGHATGEAVGMATEKSIAVLPLANAGGNPDQQFFSDGLSENLIVALSQFGELKVIGRNSAFQFRDSKEDAKTIGARLGVAHLLEGSVQHVGETVRVSAELIRAADGSTLWSQHYDRPYKDLFALQDDITQAVATALKTKLLLGGAAAAQSDRPLSRNLDAYDAYLQGQFYEARRTEAGVRKAIECFASATQFDPRYAQAWARLARAWSDLAANFLDKAAALQQAHEEARKAADIALRLAPDLAAVHVAQGRRLVDVDFDWRGAEAEYRRALELAPDDGDAKAELSFVLAAFGETDKSIELMQQALVSDPLNVRWYTWLGIRLAANDRLDEAEASLRRAIELQPNASAIHTMLTLIKIQRGDAAAALAAARLEPPGPIQDLALALAKQIGPDRAAADAALQMIIDKYPDAAAYQIAEAYALRHDADKVFEWLDRAAVGRVPELRFLLTDPLLKNYRSDPRFAALCRSLGLPRPGA